MLTIILPVRNEANIINDVFEYFNINLKAIDYEVLVINDFSEDDTLEKTKDLVSRYKNFKLLNNFKKGLGGAINLGIKKASGEFVTIMMADQSDDINDLIKYHNIMIEDNYDAVFRLKIFTRVQGFRISLRKLFLNRIFNYFVSLIFWNKYKDYTNAFKIYKKNIT